jgi:hypothetical protein
MAKGRPQLSVISFVPIEIPGNHISERACLPKPTVVYAFTEETAQLRE